MLQYVQDSLDWLTSEAEKHRSSIISVFPPALFIVQRRRSEILCVTGSTTCTTNRRDKPSPSETLGHVFLYLMDPPTRLPHPDTSCVEISRTGELSQASLVCRYWRQVVLCTPELWTMIRVSYRMKKRTVSWPWASLKLSRSGMPTYHARVVHSLLQGDIPQEDMSRLVDEAHPVRLETLLIMEDKPNKHPARGEFPCISLIYVHYRWSMRELRHLSLVNQEWKSADVRGFFAVLEANAHLEELFLERIRVHSLDDWSNVSTYIEKLPPVHLSKLKRLFIQDNFENVNMPTPMIATVHQNWNFPLTAHVRELWLDTPTWDMGTPRSVAPAASAASAVKDMQNVTKLALLRHSSFWMEQLVDSFPALTELHIFTQYCPDGPAIVRFLASRKQRDLKVRTLYFFGDQASKHCRDFVKWRESPQEFSCHVERVVFEETPFRLYDKGLLSEKFGIPEACEAPSGSPSQAREYDIRRQQNYTMVQLYTILRLA
ncbi:hypothetical protein BC629DRAFT_1444349 [Irpex lacteus]|nr:hypothetical protein BC629DRAFT_1444349 [Irpex lacteus]